MMVRKVVLRLITKAVANRQVRSRLPIVFGVQAQIDECRADRMKDLSNAELAGLVSLIARSGRSGQKAVVDELAVRSRSCGIQLTSRPQPPSEPDKVLRQLDRGVILPFEMVLG